MKAAFHYPGRLGPLSFGQCLSLLGLCLLLAACGSAPSRPAAPATPIGRPAIPQANEVLIRAIGLVGTPYRWGGNTPDSGFDCSGLIGFVFLETVGLRLPRTTREMAALERPRVQRGDLQPGDVLFFGSRAGIHHAGIYVGEGRFVHAPSTGGTVRLDSLDGHYWRDNFQFGRRMLH